MSLTQRQESHSVFILFKVADETNKYQHLLSDISAHESHFQDFLEQMSGSLCSSYMSCTCPCPIQGVFYAFSYFVHFLLLIFTIWFLPNYFLIWFPGKLYNSTTKGFVLLQKVLLCCYEPLINLHTVSYIVVLYLFRADLDKYTFEHTHCTQTNIPEWYCVRLTLYKGSVVLSACCICFHCIQTLIYLARCVY